MDRAAHWDSRYRTVGAHAVSWYQPRPTTSLELFAALDVGEEAAVVDVGGGASTLVDHLLAAGHRDVTVLDVSAAALQSARARVGTNAPVEWIATDLLAWRPTRRWDVWHDRAVLHFLVDDDDRAAYASVLRRAVVPGGAFVIGAFAEDGPTECSALPVHRYSSDELAAFVGDAEIVARRRELHHTPSGSVQPFTWVAGRLPPASGDRPEGSGTTGT
jgi:SAM-dependent methyltransferase